MNKDMINIDDFVREKLGEQPEKENPAAWLKMKALLDKEMPERAVPFYFRWGKPMAFLGAALLLAGLCVGGYELTKGIRGKSNGESVNNSTESGIANPNHSSRLSNSSSPISINTTQQSAANDASLPVAKDNTNDGNNIDTKKESANRKRSDNENGLSSGATSSHLPVENNLAKSNKHSEHISGTEKVKAEISKSNKGTSVVQTKINNRENNGVSGAISRTSSNDILATNKLPATKAIVSKNNIGVNISQSDVSDITGLKNEAKTRDEKSDKIGSAKSSKSKGELAASGAQNWAGGNQTTKAPVLQKTAIKDSLPFTSIVQKETISKKFPRKATTSVDTQGIGKIALPEIEVPVVAAANNEKASQTIQKKEADNNSNEFAAANKNKPSTQKDSATTTAGNSELTAKSKKAKRKSLWENLNLPDAAADAKRDLGNAQFFAGFSGGFNYSLSNTNNFQGVQFGPTGELVFNKHWSLFGAIRYFNRSGGTKTVNDNYSKESAANTPDSMSGPNWYFKVHTDSTSRYFNFSTLHSFEMPITLRYALNKFYLMTGLNLVYYLSVNVEEVQKTYSLNPHMVQTNSAKPILNETKPLLNTSDFGSKFGLGYVIGAGYQIAPAWQADIRLVNTFWDNAKGDGANKLSKDFYKLPSVQISVGYQFNRGRAKPTFGPTTTSP
ncbi:MAG: outer membrane beta-barrel protein [Bacteroidota bacterium]